METLSATQIAALARVINQSDLVGNGPAGASVETIEEMRNAVSTGQPHLPPVYRKAYSEPLLHTLNTMSNVANGKVMLQVGIDAVSQHAPDSPVLPELKRLVIVIADLFNTFVHDIDHTHINVSLTERLPPLASFMQSAGMGPFTIPADTVRKVIDSNVAVVSLPSSFRQHPLVWSTLSHETGGHDVIHANPGLLSEMQFGVYRHLAGDLAPDASPTQQQKMGLLWAYWMDETSADIYALLNMGPAYILGALAFFSAYLSQSSNAINVPQVRTDSGSANGSLDPHPTDVLRIGIAQGVISALTNLSDSTRKKYLKLLDDVTALVAPGVTHVSLKGDFHIQAANRNFFAPVSGDYELPEMMKVARDVGEYIASAAFPALGDNSIQAIETWDDADELHIEELTQQLLSSDKPGSEVRPTMLLSSAIMASIHTPDNYDELNRSVEKYLDQAIANSPVWGNN